MLLLNHLIKMMSAESNFINRKISIGSNGTVSNQSMSRYASFKGAL